MFQLSFPIPVSKDKIQLSDNVISIGSCFAESIGVNLKDYKFNVTTNPFGTIYNPISLSQLLSNEIEEGAVIEQNGIFYHWHAHGEVSALNKASLDTMIASKRSLFQDTLISADWLIITLGSAFAYRLKDSGRVVANCHKVPQTRFTKELLAVEDVIQKLGNTFELMSSRNPKLKIILTVSPVRHIRDGLIENNRSKARLIEVVQSLSWSSDRIKYFPAFEIMIDELRDYRFYSKDRVHPSNEAIEYIWSRFCETYFDEETSQFVKEWQSIRSALQHRPFHPQSKEHQAFIRSTVSKLKALSSKVDVSAEVSLLESQLL